MTASIVAGRIEVAGPLAFGLPPLDGWSLVDRPGTALTLTSQADAALVLHVTTAPTAGDLDPRAVGARLARAVQERTPAAVVEHRHFGWFDDRLVALQLVTATEVVHLHAVFVTDVEPRHVFVVSASGSTTEEESLGRALVAVVTGIRVRS